LIAQSSSAASSKNSPELNIHSEINDRQQQIIEDFAMFSDWSERYQYLIDLGKKIRDFPEQFRNAEHLLKGCQSQVFIATQVHDQRLKIHAISDSSIVSGLIALALQVFDEQSCAAIASAEVRFIDGIGLGSNLSMSRKNGLNALIARIKHDAANGAAA
jgi:cysteine desulfuration protein SufE